MFDDIKYKSFSLPLAFFELTFFRTFEDIINKFFSRSIDKAFNLLKKALSGLLLRLFFSVLLTLKRFCPAYTECVGKSFPKQK